MLYCDVARQDDAAFDDLVVFVDQLNAAGRPARLGPRSVPGDAVRSHRFDAAPHLGRTTPAADDMLVLLGADAPDDGGLALLHRTAARAAGADAETGAPPDAAPCYALGRFETEQARVGARARLSYALGREPVVERLADPAQRGPVFGVASPAGRAGGDDVPTVLIAGPRLEDPDEGRALRSLAVTGAAAGGGRMRVVVLTDGRSKADWRARHGDVVAVYRHGEALPASLARRVAVLAAFSAPADSYRHACLVANLVVAGAALIDCTDDHALARGSDAFVRGPLDIAGLGAFLRDAIVPNLDEIGRAVRASGHAGRVAPDRVLSFLPSPSPAEAPGAAEDGPVFVPTNGVGLGHAQRTSLIAAELGGARPTFAAFPSCMPMLQGYGFDVMPLVGRSPLHAAEHENDLLNYVRLRALTRPPRAAGGRRTLVFDGGYVFDSIYRTILENDLRGVWIRRGLWQGAQDNAIALDREKAFDRVIVPREAFPELDHAYSLGDHVRAVGPVVQRLAPDADRRAALRARLAERYGPFERLTVTMLGGGVAADRRAQLAAICGMMERRSDTLNLIVVWPTATVEAGSFAWRNTRVVKTHHASVLVAACDLFVSAAGYNSFHEALYNRVPTVFLPQMAAMMDDQRARAAAAAERGLAAMVEPHELLRLDRTVTRFLDGGEAEAVRVRLAALELPETGNARAARLIEEVSG